MRKVRRLVTLAVASLVLMQTGGPPASAQGVQVIQGLGTATPGIPQDPATPNASVHNDYEWHGVADGVFGTTAGSCNVTYNGSGDDTMMTGTNDGSLTCTNNGIGINFTCQ